MALMPGLQLNIGQQLKLTPQLQQSIKILQYSALEVQQVIKTTLETNYMLELDEERDDDYDPDTLEAKEASEAQESAEANEFSESEKPLDIESDTKIDEQLEIDLNWNDVFGDHSSAVSNKPSDDYTSAESYTASSVTLYNHLQWQVDISPFSEIEKMIASYIIDEINDEGFLSTDLKSILSSIQESEDGIEVHLEDLERILKQIQQFEPTGVAARDLQETLVLQLKALPNNPYVVTALQLINENFDWLSYHDHRRIKKVYGLSDEELTTLLKLIQTLNPRPGRAFSSDESEVIVPDLRLRRDSQKGWIVELNSDAFPNLAVNTAYIDLIDKSASQSGDVKKMREQLVEAKGLIKSIHSRGETLLRVGSFIVNRQRDFFEQGEEAMHPLVLREIAEDLELHESTISRATNQKYIQTPRGTFELKYFFSTAIGQYGSADQSSTAIKAHIKRLIDNEDPKKPLSDNKLMSSLEDMGISVARRTIAKYREALNIPSSSERKKINKFKL